MSGRRIDRSGRGGGRDRDRDRSRRQPSHVEEDAQLQRVENLLTQSANLPPLVQGGRFATSARGRAADTPYTEQPTSYYSNSSQPYDSPSSHPEEYPETAGSTSLPIGQVEQLINTNPFGPSAAGSSALRPEQVEQHVNRNPFGTQAAHPSGRQKERGGTRSHGKQPASRDHGEAMDNLATSTTTLSMSGVYAHDPSQDPGTGYGTIGNPIVLPQSPVEMTPEASSQWRQQHQYGEHSQAAYTQQPHPAQGYAQHTLPQQPSAPTSAGAGSAQIGGYGNVVWYPIRPCEPMPKTAHGADESPAWIARTETHSEWVALTSQAPHNEPQKPDHPDGNSGIIGWDKQGQCWVVWLTIREREDAPPRAIGKNKHGQYAYNPRDPGFPEMAGKAGEPGPAEPSGGGPRRVSSARPPNYAKERPPRETGGMGGNEIRRSSSRDNLRRSTNKKESEGKKREEKAGGRWRH